MHARHLVRALLRRRRLLGEALEHDVDVLDSLDRHSQPGDDANLGIVSSIPDARSKAEEHNAPVEDKLNNGVSPEGLNGYLFKYFEAAAANQEFLSALNRRNPFLGHSILPKEQKLGTVGLLESSKART